MGRKYSKKVDKKTILQGIGFFFLFLGVTVLFFQNCSQVSVSDMTVAEKNEQARILRIGAGEVTVEVGASQYDKQEANFPVRSELVSPLKQMWILDNSNTMVDNNLNLSNSFGTMFDQNNQDSLYKFDTTAYLFNTAQTIPKYSNTTDRHTITEIFDLHNSFRSIANITESIYSSQLRSDLWNFGLIPGDNVGYSVKKINNSNTDFEIQVAPVLSKKVGTDNLITLTTGIHKEANTNTTNFENDFKSKLSILNSQRIPKKVDGSGINRQQSYKVIDKESGLCAVARILQNPNGMYNPSDMLAFTIVTDENENDVNGVNCLKRTVEENGTEPLVDGKCWEYETPFRYSIDTISGQTCSISGKDGYKAAFAYPTYAYNIQYKGKAADAYSTFSIPRTKVGYTTPKTKKQWRYTNVEYHTKSCTPVVYEYKHRRTPITYYTQSCVNGIYDGIPRLECSVIRNVGTNGLLTGNAFGVHNTSQSVCNTAAKALGGANTITVAANGITAEYLPVCGTPVVDANWSATACSPVDSVNCFRQEKSAAACTYPTKVTNKKTKGDVRTVTNAQSCYDAATAHAGGADKLGLPGNLNITTEKLPKCTGDVSTNELQWEDNDCSPVDGVNCKYVSNGVDNLSVDVDGTFTSGTSGCLNHASIPAGSTGTNVCTALAERTQTTACLATETPLGCRKISDTAETTEMKIHNGVAGIKTEAECKTWISGRTDNRSSFSDTTTFSCVSAHSQAYVYSNLKFSATAAIDGGVSIAKGVGCAGLQEAFYNALSATDKTIVVDYKSSCKIDDYTNAASPVTYPLSGASCTAQAAANCSSANFRSCGTPTLGGGALVQGTMSSYIRVAVKDASCDSKCNTLPNKFCEASSDQNISIRDYFANKYAEVGKTITCHKSTTVKKTPHIGEALTGRKKSEIANLCPRASASEGVIGTPRYFEQEGPDYYYKGYIDNYVAGNAQGTNNPAADLITYIKNKVQDDNLNVNFTVFIRRTGDPEGTAGSGTNYIGTHYEKFITEVGGQKYAISASSYAPALANLSAVIKSKLIRSFAIPTMQRHQVITDVSIVRPGGTQVLAIGEWTQPVNESSIAIKDTIEIDEGDMVIVKFQNNDGYVLAQLKKIFIIDQMRPDQIVISVEHIKSSGEHVLLRTDQWIKEDNTVKIDPSVVINGGDKFKIKFKNNVDEE